MIKLKASTEEEVGNLLRDYYVFGNSSNQNYHDALRDYADELADERIKRNIVKDVEEHIELWEANDRIWGTNND